MQVTREELMQMSAPELEALAWRTNWINKRHAHQRMPEGEHWTKWLLLAGRGAGKTRTAAEEIGWLAWTNPGTRWLVAAPTSDDVLSTCYEGESGLLACIPRALVKSFTQKPPELTLINDSLIRGIPASEPDRFRGPNWHGCWLEELAAWQYDREAYDLIVFANRIGKRPIMIITTTPKPRALIRDLVKRNGKDVVLTRASTYANLANLAPTFRDEILKFEGTQRGREEIHAEVLDPEEQGIVKRSSIRMWPASKPLPWFDYIVMSLDTALTEETRDKTTGDPDYTACSVWGLFQFEKRANAMMIDAWRARLGFPELLARVKDELKSEYGQMETPIVRPLIGPAQVALETKKIDLLLIEDIGSGKTLRQVMASQGVMAYAYNPGRAKKIERLHAVSHLFAGGSSGAGVVWMTEGRRMNKDGSYTATGDFSSWAQPVVEQLVTFSGEGSIPHDDDMDAAVQALRLLSDRNLLDTIRKREGADVNATPPRPEAANPYSA